MSSINKSYKLYYEQLEIKKNVTKIDFAKKYQNIEFVNKPDVSCTKMDYWDTLAKLADSANFALLNNDSKPFLTLMESSVKNIETTGTINGKPMHWEEGMTELKYLPKEIEQEWISEVNERFLITAAILAKKADIPVNIDVEMLVNSRLSAKLNMCSPCLPNAPLNRDSHFAAQIMEVYITYNPQVLMTRCYHAMKWLINWEHEANKSGYLIPDKLRNDLILLKSRVVDKTTNDEAVEQAKSVLITNYKDRHGDEAVMKMLPSMAIKIIDLVDDDTVRKYLSMCSNEEKRMVLMNTHLIHRYELLGEIRQWLLDVSYSGEYAGFEFDEYVLAVQDKKEIIQTVTEEMGETSKNQIMGYFGKIFERLSYTWSHTKKRIEISSRGTDMSRIAHDLGYLPLETDHIHTKTEVELKDVAAWEADIANRQENNRQMEKKYNVKVWNMMVVDVLQAEMQKQPQASEESMTQALSVLRGLEGVSRENIFAVLDPKVDEEIDFVGIGTLLGLDTTNPVLSREVTSEIKTVIRILRVLEPYISFKK